MNKQRILLVDDDLNIARVTAMVLQKTQRYQVKVEHRPTQVLQSARDFQPSLILLDMNMPGKNGAEVLRELKEDQALGSTPVVFLTGLLNNHDAGRRPLLQSSKVRYISKSLDADTFVRFVDEVVAES